MQALKKINNKLALSTTGAILGFLPMATFAGTETCGSKQYLDPNGCASCVSGSIKKSTSDCVISYVNNSISVHSIIDKVTTWALTITGTLAILFLIYGGFVYITSSGNKEQLDSAKKIITYSIIGLVVIILARVIVALVINTAGEAV